jgi:hypothetical protein
VNTFTAANGLGLSSENRSSISRAMWERATEIRSANQVLSFDSCNSARASGTPMNDLEEQVTSDSVPDEYLLWTEVNRKGLIVNNWFFLTSGLEDPQFISVIQGYQRVINQ